MTLKDILNADVALIGQWLRQGLDWWLEQLRDMTPAALKPRRADAPEAVPLAPGEGFRLLRNGETIERLATPAGRPRKVVLRLGSGQALVRTLELPILSRDDTSRLVALDLDRLMPFPEGAAIHAIRMEARDPQRNRQSLRLAAALRSRALTAVDEAMAFGLTPVALLADDSDLDLLPALRLSASLNSRRLYWGVVVAALIGVNLLLLIYRDMDETARLRSLVEEQRPAASAGLRLQRTATAEQTARRDLLARRETASPMRLLATLDNALPAGAWVHRLAWNGSAVRLTGFRSSAVDMLSSLRADSRFSQVRGLTEGPQPRAQPEGRLPFDVSAVVRTRP
jgi:hypothetical protein